MLDRRCQPALSGLADAKLNRLVETREASSVVPVCTSEREEG